MVRLTCSPPVLEMPASLMNIAQFLTCAASRHPTREAIVFEERRLTYLELNSRVNALALALLDLGLRKGDKVATLLRNSNQIVEVFLAAVKMGGVLTPLNFRLQKAETVRLVNHSDATTFVFSDEFLPLVDSLRDKLDNVENFILVGDGELPDARRYEQLIDAYPPKEPDVDVQEEDACQLLYTSGTTGKPRGVILTHKNVLWNVIQTMLAREDVPDDSCLIIGPLYHTAALNNHFSIRLALAGTSVIVKQFDPFEMMTLVENEQINVISGSPTVFNVLLQLPELARFNTKSVTKITAGSAILPTETKKKLFEIFPNAHGIYDVYGCTEASPTITVLNASDSLRKHACVGKPVLAIDARLVDDDGNDLARGQVGEVVARGPTIMKGYYKDPEATQQAIRNGWLHKGDLARMDDEGFFYIVDRKKDVVISGGENVYPSEVEEVLFAHPKIAAAAVIGVPDEVWGETVRAIVVVVDGQHLSEPDVIDFCREFLAKYKCPKSVRFVPSLPTNPSGKVLKTELRKRYRCTPTANC